VDERAAPDDERARQHELTLDRPDAVVAGRDVMGVRSRDDRGLVERLEQPQPRSRTEMRRDGARPGRAGDPRDPARLAAVAKEAPHGVRELGPFEKWSAPDLGGIAERRR